MRVLVITMAAALVLTGASAQAASFGPVATVGSAPTLASAAVAGAGGTFAFVARQEAGIVGAVRRGPGAAWETHTLAAGSDFSMRDAQIVIDATGTVTALWTSEQPYPSLVAARAPAGKAFGTGHVVARLNDATGASPRMVVLPSGRVLVVFEDRAFTGPRMLSSSVRLKTIVLDAGRASAAHDLGVVGAFPAIGRVGGGAVVGFVAGTARCTLSVCAARPLRATLLDAAGRRSGPTVTVAGDAAATFYPPRVTTTGSLAVFAWVRPGHGVGSPPKPFTRAFSTRPLRASEVARPFPIFGGPGVGTPAVAILPGGGLLGADVGAGAPGGAFGGEAQVSVAPVGGVWQTPSVLTSPSGWTTVPRLNVLGDGQALAIFARARDVPGPAAYDVIAAEGSPTGALTQTTLGSSLATDDAGGLSSSVAPDGQAIVTWPDFNGGVDVVLGT
ncbi:MAG TPA: hypothetical protein VG165_14750 [Solirubrobacteraceae bacterium]|nr:hypothetical protein [Solirubrobacteraceae bacterium]